MDRYDADARVVLLMSRHKHAHYQNQTAVIPDVRSLIQRGQKISGKSDSLTDEKKHLFTQSLRETFSPIPNRMSRFIETHAKRFPALAPLERGGPQLSTLGSSLQPAAFCTFSP